MANPYISILVVDDARFSTTVISRSLKNGGYKNVRHASNAHEALEMQENDAASILIVDWLMPNMDGLQLTRKVRQMDEAYNRYTYVIMLTAKDGGEALQQAFDEGVDDFVNKASMQEQLIPRVYAAERLVDNQNRYLKQNQILIETNRDLQKLCTIDPLTGLGNNSYAQHQLEEHLNHINSRGGVIATLLLEISNSEQLKQKHLSGIYDEILVGLGRRLTSLLRPLDVITRFDDKQFLLITKQHDVTQASSKSFKRLQEGINLRAFKISTGYTNVKIAISMVVCSSEFVNANSAQVIDMLHNGMDEAKATGLITLQYYREAMQVKNT